MTSKQERWKDHAAAVEMSEKCVQNFVGIPERRSVVLGVRNILTLILEGTV